MNKTGKKPERMSFSLGDEHKDLLNKIVEISKRTRTAELRLMIEKRAQEMGLVQAPTVGKRKRGKTE